jgi:hypothetical protein
MTMCQHRNILGMLTIKTDIIFTSEHRYVALTEVLLGAIGKSSSRKGKGVSPRQA